MAYEAQGVTFDGTNDYLLRGADLTGNANSKIFTGSLWLRRNTTGSTQRIGAGALGRWQIEFISSTDVIKFECENASNVIILDCRSSAITDANWHHILWSFDLSNASNRHIYVDDASDLASVLTYTDDTIDYTVTNHSIGAQVNANSKFNGDLADVWIDFAQYIDFSVEANRRDFIGPNGGTIDLGSDGSTPTGTAPIMFFSGATSTWHTNDGTGGGFTENGAIADASTNPPTEPDGGRIMSSLVGPGGLVSPGGIAGRGGGLVG